jgi:hypothetical protein
VVHRGPAMGGVAQLSSTDSHRAWGGRGVLEGAHRQRIRAEERHIEAGGDEWRQWSGCAHQCGGSTVEDNRLWQEKLRCGEAGAIIPYYMTKVV